MKKHLKKQKTHSFEEYDRKSFDVKIVLAENKIEKQVEKAQSPVAKSED